MLNPWGSNLKGLLVLQAPQLSLDYPGVSSRKTSFEQRVFNGNSMHKNTARSAVICARDLVVPPWDHWICLIQRFP